jgi:drug/metabolite transporter (DMT)-like permease
MDLRRLRVGEWITAIAGVVLLASLFAPWYGAEGVPATSGFESLAVLDIVLALVAAAAVALLVITATQRLPAVPLTFNTLVCLLGLLGLVLVVIRALDPPSDADAREWGLWLGLAGALGIVVGSLIALRDERLSRPGRPTDLGGAPAPPRAELETLPAPPADLQSRR